MMTKIGLFLGALFYFAFSLGFVFLKYWNWFVLTVFPELPNISFNQAVGLQMFLGLFSLKVTRDLKEELYKEDALHYLIFRVLFPWFILFMGWIIYLFINN